MKKAFIKPNIEVLSFLGEDVITAISNPDGFISSAPDVNFEKPEENSSTESGFPGGGNWD